MPATELDQLRLERRSCLAHRDRSDDGLHFLAEFLVRYAEYGHVTHLWMQREHVLGFLGIDVHASADDHEILAVSEIQVPLLIDVPDIPNSRPPPIVA